MKLHCLKSTSYCIYMKDQNDLFVDFFRQTILLSRTYNIYNAWILENLGRPFAHQLVPRIICMSYIFDVETLSFVDDVQTFTLPGLPSPTCLSSRVYDILSRGQNGCWFDIGVARPGYTFHIIPKCYLHTQSTGWFYFLI